MKDIQNEIPTRTDTKAYTQTHRKTHTDRQTCLTDKFYITAF